MPETERQNILNWLSSTSYSQKHYDVRAKRLEGTGQWLLDCDVFNSWLDRSNPVLCCTGGPGVGKSVLAYV